MDGYHATNLAKMHKMRPNLISYQTRFQMNPFLLYNKKKEQTSMPLNCIKLKLGE